MKKTTLAMACCLAGFVFSSCDYLSCVMAQNPEECAIGKTMEKAVGYLADAKGIDTQEKAEKFASNWNKVQMAITSAQKLGMDVPENVKKAYNDTLERIVKHNYFDSPTLKAAMANADYIK